MKSVPHLFEPNFRFLSTLPFRYPLSRPALHRSLTDRLLSPKQLLSNHFKRSCVTSLRSPLATHCRYYSTEIKNQSLSEKFKSLSKTYGPTAFIIYLLFSTTTFIIIFTSLLNGINVQKYITAVFGTNQKEQDSNEPQQEQQGWARVMTLFAVAFGLNKLLVPLKLAATAALTPRVARFLKSNKNK